MRGVTASDEGRFAARALEVIEDDVVPLIRAGVARGDKVFGAAILRKADWALVAAGANAESENPLWHGEIDALKRFYELPRAGRPAAGDCLFVSTHEPCPLCLSAITWAGFDNFYYLYGYADTEDTFGIPHDLRILEEVFGISGGAYRRDNAFWRAGALSALVAGLDGRDAVDARERLARLDTIFRELSAAYQADKGATGIPLA